MNLIKYQVFRNDKNNQTLILGEIYITEKLQGENIMMKDYLNKTRNNVKEKKRCTFVLTPKSILAKPVGFAYQKGSELKALLDPT